MNKRYDYEHSKKRVASKKKASIKFKYIHPNYSSDYFHSINGQISHKKARINFKKNNPINYKRIHDNALSKYLNNPLKHECYLFVKCLKRINFIYERCALCSTNKNIQLHHPNYNISYHFYFLCRKCHRAIHVKELK